MTLASLALVVASCSPASPSEVADDLATQAHLDCLSSQGVVVLCPLSIHVADSGWSQLGCDSSNESYEALGPETMDAVRSCEAELSARYPSRQGVDLALVAAARRCLEDAGFLTLPGSVFIVDPDGERRIEVENAQWQSRLDSVFVDAARACRTSLDDVMSR